MKTHKQEVDVPDGFEIEGTCRNWAVAGNPAYGHITYTLKPAPPPESLIEPCPFCGGKVMVRETIIAPGTWLVTCKVCPMDLGDTYPTLAEAIAAANRRAR